MGTNTQKVVIKGTKDGLVINLDDQCAYDDLIQELEDRIKAFPPEESTKITVKVDLGYRYVSSDQCDRIRQVIELCNSFSVEWIESLVVSKQEAIQWKKRNEMTKLCKVIRSGQIIHAEGDLLLVGDVNPGGKVIAKGNIFILGSLKGIAHAGADGDQEAIVAATHLEPMQIFIANVISRAPDHKHHGSSGFDFAYINEEQNIEVSSLNQLLHIRPNFSNKERGKEPWAMQS